MANVFMGGIPTDIDVNRLNKAFGVPTVGSTIHYPSIDQTLGLTRKDHRWRTVVGAWRRKLDREHNIILKARSNEGFIVLDGAGRVDLSGRIYKGGLRRISRATTVAARTDRAGLSAEDVRVLDHITATGASLRLAAATAARAINYDPKGE